MGPSPRLMPSAPAIWDPTSWQDLCRFKFPSVVGVKFCNHGQACGWFLDRLLLPFSVSIYNFRRPWRGGRCRRSPAHRAMGRKERGGAPSGRRNMLPAGKTHLNQAEAPATHGHRSLPLRDGAPATEIEGRAKNAFLPVGQPCPGGPWGSLEGNEVPLANR